MADLKFSIVIPYKQRLDNIRIVFASLADQTMPASDFEIVVGAMEYSPEYVEVCRQFMDRLSIVSVLTNEEWNAQGARNLAIKHAAGQVLVVLDADMAVPVDFLDNLYDRYFQHGQKQCVVGQMMGYDNVWDRDMKDFEVLPYSHYRTVLADLETADRAAMDSRWHPEFRSALARFPWAFARTAVMALPLATVLEHDLLLDEGFRGWGPEDQEWGYRIALSGTPLIFPDDVWALHLPHYRDLRTNEAEADVTNRYYLGKWPRLDLELALVFGWLDTDRRFPEVERELAGCVSPGHRLGVVRGVVDGRDVVVVGAELDSRTHTPVPSVTALFDGRFPRQVLPLVGFALPYDDDEVEECRVMPAIGRLSTTYRAPVVRTANRVARKLVLEDAALEDVDLQDALA